MRHKFKCVQLVHSAAVTQSRLILRTPGFNTCWPLTKSGILSTAASTIRCIGGFVVVVVLVCLCEVNAPQRLLTVLAAPRRSTSSSPITTPPPQSRLRSAPAESAASEWALEWPRTASTLHVGSSGGEASHHRHRANKCISL